MATVYNTLRCGLYPFKHQLVTGLLKFLNLVKLQCLLPAVRFMRLFFRMPFFAVYGDKDNCMITFLDNIGLQNVLSVKQIKRKNTKKFFGQIISVRMYFLQKKGRGT